MIFKPFSQRLAWTAVALASASLSSQAQTLAQPQPQPQTPNPAIGTAESTTSPTGTMPSTPSTSPSTSSTSSTTTGSGIGYGVGDAPMRTAQANTGRTMGSMAYGAGGDAYSLLPYTRRGYVGINLGKPEFDLACGSGGYNCGDPSVAGYVYTGGLFTDWIGVELGYLHTSNADRARWQHPSPGRQPERRAARTAGPVQTPSSRPAACMRKPGSASVTCPTSPAASAAAGAPCTVPAWAST